MTFLARSVSPCSRSWRWRCWLGSLSKLWRRVSSLCSSSGLSGLPLMAMRRATSPSFVSTMKLMVAAHLRVADFLETILHGMGSVLGGLQFGGENAFDQGLGLFVGERGGCGCCRLGETYRTGSDNSDHDSGYASRQRMNRRSRLAALRLAAMGLFSFVWSGWDHFSFIREFALWVAGVLVMSRRRSQ